MSENCSLKYFSWKWLVLGTWTGMLGTELLGKGFVLKPSREFLESIYTILIAGGDVFTVMTGLGILVGGLMPYFLSIQKERDSLLDNFSMMIFAILFAVLFGGIFVMASNSLFGLIFGAVSGVIFGLIFGKIVTGGGIVLKRVFVSLVRNLVQAFKEN